MNTKHQKIVALLLGAGLLGLSGIASAAITNSKHDLGSASTTTVNKVTDTDETCVFCHTPHAAAGNTVPLWNKNLTAAPVTTYSSTTMDGTVDFTGSTSVACLSCHDGTQAMDNIVNASGSGNYTANGGGAGGLGYNWTLNATADATGTLDATALTNLSTNLGDDHPVAIPYGGGGITAAAGTDIATDPDFRDINDTVVFGATTYTLKRGTQGSQSVVWFDSGTNPTRIDSNEIRLYTVTGKTNPQVECASCHDPHKGETTTFLRIANTSSAVCVTCHVK